MIRPLVFRLARPLARSLTFSSKIAALIVLLLPSFSNADFYEYVFTGIVPEGVSNHSMVSDGEVWTATMIIDSTTADTNSDAQFGVYTGAVVSGSLVFSGGYEPFVDFSGATAFALNDVFPPADADAVSVRGEFNDSNYVFQANTTDLSTLTSDALVGPGVSFDSSPSPSELAYFVFTYADEFGDIVYFGDTANNASFSATSIPEPGFAGILIFVMAGISRRTRN